MEKRKKENVKINPSDWNDHVAVGCMERGWKIKKPTKEYLEESK